MAVAGALAVERDDLVAVLQQAPAEPRGDEAPGAGHEHGAIGHRPLRSPSRRPAPAALGARFPHAPRRVAGRPQVVEHDRVLVGVHAVPEALVAVGAQVPLGREPGQRLVLEHARLVHVVEHPRLEAEEAAVHPMVEPRLLLEGRSRGLPSPSVGDAELAARADDRHGREVAVARVEADQRPQVDVGDAVGVGRAERRRPRRGRRRAATRPPVGVSRPVSTHSISTACGPRLRGDVVADHLAEVSGRAARSAEALRGVDPDHVPQDRPAADLDEGLGDRMGVLLEAGSAASAQDYDIGPTCDTRRDYGREGAAGTTVGGRRRGSSRRRRRAGSSPRRRR